MNAFKSSPLIQDRPKPRLTRQLKGAPKRGSKEHQLLIANPFRHAASSLLPSDLKAQLQHIDYISPSHIQKITFTTPGARRSSNFARQLQIMQNAAKKQAEMHHYFNCGASEGEECETEIVEDEPAVVIEEDQQLSSRMDRFFRMVDREQMEEQPFAFSNEDSEDIIFYSQNIIQDERYEDCTPYFDV